MSSPTEEPLRVGVVGCGAVSRQYLPVVTQLRNLKIVAVSDLEVSRAKEVEKEYGIPQATTESILADPDVELILNLTPIAEHIRVTRAGLAAGKHVYSEKPLAPNLRDARTLTEIAKQTNLTLAAAPDTTLGPSFQAARRLMEMGRLGRPLAATAHMFRASLTDTDPGAAGPTPFYDMAPYYLTALINLFGSGCQVSAYSREVGRDDTSMLWGTIEFLDGFLASLVLAWGTTLKEEIGYLMVFGSEGILRFANPNTFGEPAYYRLHGSEDWIEVDGSRETDPGRQQLRGLGVADTARAIRSGSTPRCNADIALHVVNILDSMLESSSIQANVDLVTRCEKAAPLTARDRSEFLRH